MVDSAGILLHRRTRGGPEVLLGHLGGPFWARKDEAAWTIPKGVVEPGESLEEAAAREWVEELGVPVPPGPWRSLGSVRQSRKTVHAWAVRGDLDPATIVPGTTAVEWPRGSGRLLDIPEIDRVAWFTPAAAAKALVVAQREFLDRLEGRPADEPGRG